VNRKVQQILHRKKKSQVFNKEAKAAKPRVSIDATSSTAFDVVIPPSESIKSDSENVASIEDTMLPLKHSYEVDTENIVKPHQTHIHEFLPRIVVIGIGGGGSNAVNNMIKSGLKGVDFVTCNTDAQHLSTTLAHHKLQIGPELTSGLGCGANPVAGREAAEESKDQITELVQDSHMVFVTAGMGGGTGTGASPVVAEICYNLGILTVGIVTKPFRFEGSRRMRIANDGIIELRQVTDSLIVVPNQNLFNVATENTSFLQSFAIADNVLLDGVKSVTDLMTTPGLINLDFADVQNIMHGTGNAYIGTGIASNGDNNEVDRAMRAAQMALTNPLLGENVDISSAKGLLISISGGRDMLLFEVEKAAQVITERISDENANIVFGSAYDESLDGSIRISVVATGIDEVTSDF
jgi:cell division protein FtsZ